MKGERRPELQIAAACETQIIYVSSRFLKILIFLDTKYGIIPLF